MTRIHQHFVLPAVVAALVGLTACGSSGGSSATTASASSATTAASSTSLRPEDVFAPLTEVKVKLPALVTLGNTAKDQAAAGDYDGAGDTLENLENLWFEVEGTVGDLDRDVYEAAETAQGLIRDGVEAENAGRVAQGASDQAKAIQTFLDAHPS